MIGVTLCFPNRLSKSSDKYYKRGRGKVKIFLALIYHHVEHDNQELFNKELASFYNAIPGNSKLLASQATNSNICVRSKMFYGEIKTNEIDNRNAKVIQLLFLLNSIKLRLLLTYFRHSNYTTWRSFKFTIYSQMLDNFICSRPFFFRVKDRKVVNIGMRSDPTAIIATFKIPAIKLKVTEKVVAQINWKLIGYHKMNNELFKISLSNFIAGGTT